MTLTADRKKQYRNLGHKLKPVVTVAGNGLSETVMTELNRALEDHELIKVKVVVEDREKRKEVIMQMCRKSHSEVVQEIGKVALLYRKAKKQNLKLSNITSL